MEKKSNRLEITVQLKECFNTFYRKFLKLITTLTFFYYFNMYTVIPNFKEVKKFRSMINKSKSCVKRLSFVGTDPLIDLVVNNTGESDNISQLGLEGVSNLPVHALAETVAQTYLLTQGLPTAVGVVVGVTILIPAAQAALESGPQAFDPSVPQAITYALNTFGPQAIHAVTQAASAFGPQAGEPVLRAIAHAANQAGGPVVQAVAQAVGEPVVRGVLEQANLSLEERAQLPVADALVNSTCCAGEQTR